MHGLVRAFLIQSQEWLVLFQCRIYPGLVLLQCRIYPGLVLLQCRIYPGLVLLQCRIYPGLVLLQCRIYPELVLLQCRIYPGLVLLQCRIYPGLLLLQCRMKPRIVIDAVYRMYPGESLHGTELITLRIKGLSRLKQTLYTLQTVHRQFPFHTINIYIRRDHIIFIFFRSFSVSRNPTLLSWLVLNINGLLVIINVDFDTNRFRLNNKATMDIKRLLFLFLKIKNCKCGIYVYAGLEYLCWPFKKIREKSPGS